MTDSYKVTFDDGEVEWLTPGKKDGPPEVGDIYTKTVDVDRTIIHVESPVAADEAAEEVAVEDVA